MMANGPLLTGGAQDQLAKLYGHLGKQESTPRSPRTTSHIYLTNPSQEGTAVMKWPLSRARFGESRSSERRRVTVGKLAFPWGGLPRRSRGLVSRDEGDQAVVSPWRQRPPSGGPASVGGPSSPRGETLARLPGGRRRARSEPGVWRWPRRRFAEPGARGRNARGRTELLRGWWGAAQHWGWHWVRLRTLTAVRGGPRARRLARARRLVQQPGR